LRGAENRDCAARLGEGGGVRGVGVDDAANVRKAQKELSMRRRVGRGIEPPLDPLSIEIDENHVVGRQRRVVDPARLDRENAARAVDSARVAECEIDETGPWQRDIGFIGFAPEFGQHRRAPARHARKPCASA
jgi:hypothetical protein